MLIRNLLCTVLCVLPLASASAKVFDKSEIISLFQSVFSSPVLVEQQITKLGLQGEKAELFRQVYKDYSKDEELLNYFATQMEQVGFGDQKFGDDVDAYYRYTFELLTNLQADLYRKGVLKLGGEDIVILYERQLRVAELLSPKMCKNFFEGNVDQYLASNYSEANKRIIRQSSIQELRSFYTHFNRALKVALNEDYQTNPLTASEKRFASDAFQVAIQRGLEAMPKAQQERMINVALDFDGASDKDICEFYKFSLKQMLKLESPIRDWTLKMNLEMLEH